jgi:hypothetical protein
LHILYRQQLEHPSAKMNILEKHRRFLKNLRFCFYYCGCEVFDTDFKFNFRTLSSIFVVSTYQMCAFNTFFVWPLSYALECLATYGMALTVRSQRARLINPIIAIVLSRELSNLLLSCATAKSCLTYLQKSMICTLKC